VGFWQQEPCPALGTMPPRNCSVNTCWWVNDSSVHPHYSGHSIVGGWGARETWLLNGWSLLWVKIHEMRLVVTALPGLKGSEACVASLGMRVPWLPSAGDRWLWVDLVEGSLGGMSCEPAWLELALEGA
jgi:hypothetical protein